MNILINIDRVERLLKLKPHLRDDDSKLIANIWYDHFTKMKINLKKISGYDLLQLIADGKLPNPQSIRRARRKLQEEFPELQGKKWEERHKEQDNVIEQLTSTPSILAGGRP